MVNNIDEKQLKISSNPFLRWLLIISGFVLTGIGIAGMFLPLLPTTIFLLLAAWCFARSSEKFYKWLHNNRFFGKYLSDYSSGRGMTLRSKIFSITFLWAGILFSVFYATEVFYVRILLLTIAIGVTWHLLAIKTADKN
ncbi:MAG TPA: YbaN family protein [Ignavibacteria bacterium]|nr:YbaN family protein [Ignavibacteria bacterium]HMR39648.1 YbaN family protein [Ignavibacteria bacterium]